MTAGGGTKSTVMTGDNRIFVDTNVLLALTDASRGRHAEALAFIDQGLSGKLSLFINGQVMREYLVVATRPVAVNGLGLGAQQAVANIRTLRRCLTVLPDDPATTDRLCELVSDHDLKGKRIHDANLVASMHLNGLRRLKTFNPDDFRRFVGLHLE